jgi:hypothetical protein
MKEQGKQFEWKNLRELLTQVSHVEGRYGNYKILRLSKKRHIIIDRINFTFLASSSDSPYILPKHWDWWLKRGFIVITFPGSHGNSRYYILNAKSKKFIAGGERLEVKADFFLIGQSDYFMAGNKHIGYAIYDKDGNQISGFYDKIGEEGLVDGQSDYYVAGKDGKVAIFDKNGNQITDWYDEIMPYGLVINQSDYYWAKKDNKYAIFDKDGQRISDWFDHIEGYGSNYYLVEQDGWKTILYQDGEQVTDWFDDIGKEGLLEGFTDYYIAEKDDQKAIFYKDVGQITDWFDDVYPEGLVTGHSGCYIARKKGKEAIFDIDGIRISGWFDAVFPYGLVFGQSDYYVVKKRERDKLKEFYYIHKLGSKKSIGPFKEILDWGFIEDFIQNSISVITSTDQQITLIEQEVKQFFENKEVENGR